MASASRRRWRATRSRPPRGASRRSRRRPSPKASPGSDSLSEIASSVTPAAAARAAWASSIFSSRSIAGPPSPSGEGARLAQSARIARAPGRRSRGPASKRGARFRDGLRPRRAASRSLAARWVGTSAAIARSRVSTPAKRSLPLRPRRPPPSRRRSGSGPAAGAAPCPASGGGSGSPSRSDRRPSRERIDAAGREHDRRRLLVEPVAGLRRSVAGFQGASPSAASAGRPRDRRPGGKPRAP